MPQPPHNNWSEWIEILRDRRDAARETFAQWVEDCRAEPELIWQTTAVRYSTYGAAALVLLLAVRTLVGFIQPGDPAKFQPRAKTAFFDVICSSCQRHFVIERRFKFDDFPVRCPSCNQPTAQRALRCHSDICQGRLVVTRDVDGVIYCTECNQPIGPPD